jgi:hypothetical protein
VKGCAAGEFLSFLHFLSTADFTRALLTLWLQKSEGGLLEQSIGAVAVAAKSAKEKSGDFWSFARVALRIGRGHKVEHQ